MILEMERYSVQQKILIFKMKGNFDNINDSLEIEKQEIVIKKINTIHENIDTTIIHESEYDEKKDYDYVRLNLYSLVEKAQQSLNQVMEVAQQTDSPRAYEVVFQGIKHAAEVTDKLIDLQQKMKKLKEDDIKAPSTINNTMFVGSTAELQKLLKQNSFQSK